MAVRYLLQQSTKPEGRLLYSDAVSISLAEGARLAKLPEWEFSW